MKRWRGGRSAEEDDLHLQTFWALLTENKSSADSYGWNSYGFRQLMDVWLAWSHHLNKTILSFAPPAPKLNKVTLCSTLSGISLLMRTKSNFQKAERCLCAVFLLFWWRFCFFFPSITQAEQIGSSALSCSRTWNNTLDPGIKTLTEASSLEIKVTCSWKHHLAWACNTAL